MEKQIFRLAHDEARRRAMSAVANAPEGWKVTIQEPSRNLEQNALLWTLLQAFANQLQWPVNGKMERLDATSWKDILTAAFEGEQARVSPGLNGGMVLLGLRTSQFSKHKFSEFLEFLHATAADRGVDLQLEEHHESVA